LKQPPLIRVRTMYSANPWIGSEAHIGFDGISKKFNSVLITKQHDPEFNYYILA
jgi:hypothetical protein